MRTRLALAIALGCSELWAAPNGSLEQTVPTSAERHAAPPRVRVILVGPEPASSFRQRLQSWFQSETRVTIANAATLRVDQILGDGQPNVVDVWLDLRVRDVVHVYLVVSGKDAGRRLVRDLALEHGMDELDQERLAQVVFSSVLAVWEGHAESARAEIERRLGASEARKSPPVRASAEPKTPKSNDVAQGPAVEMSPGSRPLLTEYSARVGYGISARGREGLAHGPELWAIMLQRRHRALMGGFLMARYLVPFDASQGDLTLKLTGMRAKVGMSVGWIANEVFRTEAGAGIGADVIHYEPYVSSGLFPQSGDTEVRPVVGVFIAGSIPAGPARIVLAALADVQLVRTNYQISRQGQTHDVLTPWLVQPGLVVAFALGSESP